MLAQIAAIIILGVILNLLFVLYKIFQNKLKNWKIPLCIAVILYTAPFLTLLVLEEDSALSNLIFGISYPSAFVLTWMTIFLWRIKAKR